MKKSMTILMVVVMLGFSHTTDAQSGPFIGQVSMFAGNFAPRGWAFCDGQLLPISQNQALFSILGTTYGGDGRTTFALPDLRGRAPIHEGRGPGLTPRSLGQRLGSESTTLTVSQMPSHAHNGKGLSAMLGSNSKKGKTDEPNGSHFGKATGKPYNSEPNNGSVGEITVGGKTGATGGNQSHNNMQPSLAINYVIALRGVFPSRN